MPFDVGTRALYGFLVLILLPALRLAPIALIGHGLITGLRRCRFAVVGNETFALEFILTEIGVHLPLFIFRLFLSLDIFLKSFLFERTARLEFGGAPLHQLLFGNTRLFLAFARLLSIDLPINTAGGGENQQHNDNTGDG